MVVPIVPIALRKGDTIAFVSPSARLNDITPAAMARAKTHFEKLGFKVKVIFNPTKDLTFPEITAWRCEELHSAFRDPEIKAIICTSGGAHANELLPHLDYELIKSNPKIFVGYSDITRLHYGIFMNTGLQTFYGPCAITEFGESPEPFSFTTNHFLHVLQDSVDKPAGQVPQSKEWAKELPDFLLNEPDSEKPRKMTPNPGWKWLRPGKATGRIIGGCLTSVGNAKGTRYFPTSHHGKILLLENAMGEKRTSPVLLADTRSWLADLVHTGIFEQIAGLVIGRPYAHDEEMKKVHDRIVLEQLEGTTFPILSDVDVGHTDPIITIPLNVLVSLDSEKDEFSFFEAAVRLG